MVGGYDVNVNTVTSIWIYNPRNDSWSSTPSLALETSRAYPGVAALDGAVYVFGGLSKPTSANAVLLNSIERCTLQGGCSTLTDTKYVLPIRLCSIGAAAVGNTIYLAGGALNLPQMFSVIVAYNFTLADGWTQIANLNSGRRYHGVVAVDGVVYVVGGYATGTGGGPIANIEYYTPETNQWHYLTASLSTARFLFSMAVCQGVIYVLGGQGVQSSPLTSVEMLAASPTTQALSATSWNTSARALDASRYGNGCGAVLV